MKINSIWFKLSDLERLVGLIGSKFNENKLKCCIFGREDSTIVKSITDYVYTIITNDDIFLIWVDNNNCIVKIK